MKRFGLAGHALSMSVLLGMPFLCVPDCIAQSSPQEESQSSSTSDEGKRDDGKPAPDSKDKPGDGESDGKTNNDSDADKSKDDAKDRDMPQPADAVMRPGEPPEPPDPKEFDLRPDPDGRLRFHFQNQPWPEFLQWLAEVSGYSLDWQQMPGGYLNLVTHRTYTVSEARDVVNRMLLDRGYTMLLQRQVLSVVKLDKLDPSLLPRVEDEAALVDLPPHEFAKITFSLPLKLKAAALAEDAKTLLSPYGKVQPLLASNRLLVIDAVANLREVSRLVNAEHAAADSHLVPREFHIQHVRADYVADQVMILLGLDPSTRRSPSELQVEQQRLQLFMQMQQRGKDVSKFLRGDDAPTVFVTVNKRVNSVLVNAPPTELIKIERAIKQLDVPSGTAGGSMVAGGSAVGQTVEMRRYALISLKPESVVNALKEIGDLDPRTMLQMDADAKVIFASATVQDHEKISAIIDKLDGLGREIEVVWLKRLPADQAAITIRSLLVGKEEKKEERRSFYSWQYNDDAGKDKPDSGFRVEADIENNRLLLFANKSELEAVNNLLVKLGELPGESGNPNTIRVQDSRGEKANAELLRQLKQVWPDAANPLRIETINGSQKQEVTDSEAESRQGTPQDDQATPPNADAGVLETRRDNAKTSVATRLAGLQAVDLSDLPSMYHITQSDHGVVNVNLIQTASENLRSDAKQAADTQDSALPPISISVTADGRLILSSTDTAALDTLEELINRLAPPPKKHRVFYLQYALASMVTLNLKEYFEDEQGVNSEENWMRAWFGMEFKNENAELGGLSRRRPVRFIYDIDTNSVLVRDATPQQMETIEDLIEIYDKAPSEESISARRLKAFRLKYSDAEVVATTIKDVFRDLLSYKDKEFAGMGDKEKQSSNSRTFRIFGSDDKDDKPTKVKASFEGALSVGVDRLANSIIVSAQEDWMASIEEMIEFLDESAKPDTTVVVQSLKMPMNAESMQALAAMLRPWPGNKKPQADGSARPEPLAAEKQQSQKPDRRQGDND